MYELRLSNVPEMLRLPCHRLSTLLACRATCWIGHKSSLGDTNAWVMIFAQEAMRVKGRLSKTCLLLVCSACRTILGILINQFQ